MSEKYKPVLSCRVSQSILDRIDKIVEKTENSRADVIERALGVGLRDQEKFVENLEGFVTGPLLQLLSSERFLNIALAMMGDEPDPNQIKAAKNVRERMKRGNAKGATT